MSKLSRSLLAMLLYLLWTAAFAQTPVNIVIEGINAELEKNVRLYLSIEQQKDHPLISDGRLRRLHQKAPEEISAALQPFGYYRAVINARLQKQDDDSWQAVYTIDAGARLKIGEFNFSVSEALKTDIAFLALIETETPKVGDDFNHLDYERFKSNLARLAAERGYFDANFTEHRVEIDLDDYIARIYLNYDGGPRYRFGEVIMKQDVLNPRFLNRYLPFQQGDAYQLDLLIDLQHDLNDSDYFQTVEISPTRSLAESHEVPVEVSLTPRKRHRINFGIGYGSDTGARTSLGWQMPRVNKKGHRFDSRLDVSELGYEFLSNYHVPVLDPRTDEIVYSLGETREKSDSSDSTLRTVGIGLRRSRGDWRETVSINYQQEDFTVADDSGSSTLLIPGVGWSRTWGGDFINVLDGLRFDISLRGASEDLGSETQFGQVQGNLKFISSMTESIRLIARGGLGSTATDDFDDLPASIRFFSGGGQSVRGYKYQSLGPIDENGDVVGARHLLFGSLEFDYYFNQEWGAAIFYDSGNAIDDFDDELESGAGFGIRWKSPVGPVRVDLAQAISTDEQDWRLHISIGPDL